MLVVSWEKPSARIKKHKEGCIVLKLNVLKRETGRNNWGACERKQIRMGPFLS